MARRAAGRVDACAATAAYLRSRGLSAPKIEALDVAQGLAVIEDFGEGVFARLMEQGQDEAELYFAAMDAQARLHESPPPAALSVDELSWPLLAYDAVALKAGADLFVEWQPKLNPALDLGAEARAEWDELWTDIAKRGRARRPPSSPTVIHHAENPLWLPERPGRGAGRDDRFPGRLAGPPELGPAFPVAGRPPRRVARIGGCGPQPLFRPAPGHRAGGLHGRLRRPGRPQRGPHPRRVRPPGSCATASPATPSSCPACGVCCSGTWRTPPSPT